MASYLYYAIAVGLLAAMASLFGKLAFEGDTVDMCVHTVWDMAGLGEKQRLLAGYVGVEEAVLGGQALSFAFIFLCNALMVNFNSKSLDACSSAVVAVVTSTGLNFFISAAFGWLFFDEALSLQWAAGASLIIAGLWFIHMAATEAEAAAVVAEQEGSSKKQQ